MKAERTREEILRDFAEELGTPSDPEVNLSLGSLEIKRNIDEKTRDRIEIVRQYRADSWTRVRPKLRRIGELAIFK